MPVDGGGRAPLCPPPVATLLVRAITPFKIIKGHRDQYKAKARMRHHISD